MAEEKHHQHLFHHKEEDEKAHGSDNFAGDGYGKTTAAPIKTHDYEKEKKKHKDHEHLGELGVATTGIYAVHEKHKAGKDPEHAHKHKIEEETAAVAAVGTGGYAFHEKHEKKNAEKLDEEAHDKKHHHLF